MAKVDRYLKFTSKNRGSDLHLKTGSPPLVRIDGDLERLKADPLSAEQVQSMAQEIMPERNLQEFEAVHDTDFCYELDGVGRFRTNAYHDLKGPALAMRLIPQETLGLDDLALNDKMLDLFEDLPLLPKGVVLCTGPTGCGKSTTLAALLNRANRERTDHIITIEDPVEFVHEDQGCIVSHREVGTHCDSFKRALRVGLREDPDVILVGEMRDLETTALALRCAETGHLVFSTIHTTTATSSVDRIIDQFPADQQEQIRLMLSSTLKAVISQTLCRRKNGGRVAAFEILYVHSAVANLIREKKTYQLDSQIQTGRKYGMCTMNDSLMSLVRDDIITPAEAYRNAVDKAGLNEELNKHFLRKVQNEEMAPIEALKKSFEKPDMMKKLNQAGYKKALKNTSVEDFKPAEFAETE